MKIKSIVEKFCGLTLGMALLMNISTPTHANELDSEIVLEDSCSISQQFTQNEVAPPVLATDLPTLSAIENSLNQENNFGASTFAVIPSSANTFKITSVTAYPLYMENGTLQMYPYGYKATDSALSNGTVVNISISEAQQESKKTSMLSEGKTLVGWRITNTFYMDCYLRYHVIYDTYNHLSKNNQLGSVINSSGYTTVTTDYLLSTSTPDTFTTGIDGYGVMGVYYPSINRTLTLNPEFSSMVTFK